MLVDYGSDNSDSDNEQSPPPVSKPKPLTNQTAPKSSLASSLPPPSRTTSTLTTTSSSLSLPKPRRRDGPLKITLEAPKRNAEDEADAEPEDRRPTKRIKLEGAGKSSLMSMLPAPTSKAPLPPPKLAPVAPRKNTLAHLADLKENKYADEEDNDYEEKEEVVIMPGDKSAIAFVPRALKAKPKPPPQVKPAEIAGEPPMDFFSLNASLPIPKLKPSTSSLAPSSSSSITIKAAPEVKEFIPPEPTQQDEYPGYYQLPNGKWQMYEPNYFNSYVQKWTQEYQAQEKARYKELGGFDPASGHLKEVSAMDEANRTRAELESTKSLTADILKEGPKAPNMKVTAARTSNVARQRHQLSTLLTDAYSHRAEIEDKIAQAKRNRKEAGNKYGF